jgi:ketosteroid isomerase-like protein
VSETVVERLWALFEARDWNRAAAELADDFVAEWPRTGERFHGRDVFIAMNRAHPAPNWHVAVKRVIAEGDQVAAEVEVTHDDGMDFCLGFYEIRQGRIATATEYWVERTLAPTPEWRAEWTSRVER